MQLEEGCVRIFMKAPSPVKKLVDSIEEPVEALWMLLRPQH